MSVSPVYQATKVEVEARREALLDLIADGHPMTVRQVFYQATVRGLGAGGRLGGSASSRSLGAGLDLVRIRNNSRLHRLR
jgi:hypothetical protein